MPQSAPQSSVPDLAGHAMSLAVQPLNPVEQASREGLEQAFSLFSQMSTQLTDSYSLLEARVTELKGELAVVSAQRMAELAEKERLANRLQNLLDLLPGGVIVIDDRGRVREANPAACELLGLPLEGELWRHVITRCFAPREDDGHEISLIDGRRLSISTRSLDAEPGQLVLLNDLTETRRLQDQLARHERLSSLGRMVASLAHQIRTPLSAALIYASHLTEQQLPVETQQRFAGRLKERLHELEHQVRDMLVFARGELPLTDRIAPKALMQALQAAAQPHVEGIAMRWQCDIHDGELLCNRDTLVGALLNLIENALQAGTAQVRLKVHVYARGNTLRLCVSDSGSGIEPQVLERLGEPFFTTKATGTGLGLAVVKAVVRAHQGQLQLHSRRGRGTCALLSLPLLSLQATACAGEAS
ncbi:PAS domain-containing sensor histidine kinase [Pseudomonas lundensis]|jgi:two-component system, sensor histidine kinase FlrB|uniref:histidine kinase n=2 Tax=Pseudomonas TaxID=286 RepID=A0AAX2H6D4_9PSED|nr:PAS domain-containing sensor histidine kinase [Pseudomonas lundensis]OZY36994.1 PAS domain-containing sensor histidine kinase [Pseudomonas lundensis]OZY46209.1 PAS domain-containing sensor histidine kinase [Pseudomonas lundensis]OZY55733.1 PAS domain-containing sensor histidine kinase [Pseudomonas lundensis]SDQ60872.1 PAS/PAC sensor signal transduction histidine kinase [Pseudomonas lundensis]